jgi:hypothetical protein
LDLMGFSSGKIARKGLGVCSVKTTHVLSKEELKEDSTTLQELKS